MNDEQECIGFVLFSFKLFVGFSQTILVINRSELCGYIPIKSSFMRFRKRKLQFWILQLDSFCGQSSILCSVPCIPMRNHVSYETFVNMQRIVVLQTRSGISFAKEGESTGIAYDPIELRGPDFGKQQA